MGSRRRLFIFTSLLIITTITFLLRSSIRPITKSLFRPASSGLIISSAAPHPRDFRVATTTRAQEQAPVVPQADQIIMSAKQAVEKHISENHVVVFSKSYCPYCRKAKSLLSTIGESPKVFELDQMGEEGSDWQAYLGDKTGQRTVPSIWIDGEFVGGSSDLEGKHQSGELKKLLGGKL